MRKHLLWAAIMVVFALILPLTGQAGTISYNVTSDNAFYMSLSTDPYTAGTPIASADWWLTAVSGTAPLNNISVQYLQIYAINKGGPAGFMGDFTLNNTNFYFANMTQSLVTNTTDWSVSTTGFNVSPVVATDYGANGVSPWGTISGISSNANWIWTNNVNNYNVYFSVPIYSSVPLPPTVMLLGSGLIGLGLLRRNWSLKK
jgi:hypothetical protein